MDFSAAYTAPPMMTITKPGHVVAGRYAKRISSTTDPPKMYAAGSTG